MIDPIIDLLPHGQHRVLLIGDFDDDFVAAVVARGTVEVWHVIVPSVRIRRTPSRVAHVVVATLHTAVSSLLEPAFDVAIIGRYLESTSEPLGDLKQLRSVLRPNAAILGEVANACSLECLTTLLSGNITYGCGGVMDTAQRRLYTLRELEKLLYRADFAVELVQGEVPNENTTAEIDSRSNTVRFLGQSLVCNDSAQAAEISTSRYRFRARYRPRPKVGLTSLVVLTHNEWAYTKLCLASIRERTDEPYELVVVDNASKDSTLEHLRGDPEIVLIENSWNRGFPAAVNQGIQAASGRNILLLNNDCIVTTGWLRRMLDALHSDPAIGVVGPATNHTPGPQKVVPGYSSLADLDGFAWKRAQKYAGVREDSVPLFGFCMLISRAVIDAVGLFDERFGIGVCEDDDFCYRGQQAGFRLVIARDAYVHHFGSRTFIAEGIDLATQLETNHALLNRKWNSGA